MWEGLVAHNQNAWVRGSRVLSRDPFFAPDDELRVPEEKLDDLSALASEAENAKGWKKRADLYGQFLAACADCHQAYAQ